MVVKWWGWSLFIRMSASTPRSQASALSSAGMASSARVSRRAFVSTLTAALPLTVRAQSEAPAAESSEAASPVLKVWEEGLGEVMRRYMDARRTPGGSLAVVKDGRLVFARGYGWADREKQEPVRPDSRFRIASISKPITALAVLKLVEAGKLRLDQPMLDFFGEAIKDVSSYDERLPRITIRHLLQHTGGWDRDISGDPMFKATFIAREMGVTPPAGWQQIIPYVLRQPLDFDPGARYAYSNFGYCLLGRIIEQLSGQSYESYVRQVVLEPCGIKDMALGATREEARAEREVKYYMPENETAKSVFPDQTEPVPWPYGGFYLEPMDSHGGWIASAPDLVRLTAALADGAKNPLLPPAYRSLLFEPPAPPASREPNGLLQDTFYTCGWLVRRKEGRFLRYSHNGSLPGTWTILTQRADGISWAVLFNQRSNRGKADDFEIDGALNRWFDAVKEFPPGDGFAQG